MKHVPALAILVLLAACQEKKAEAPPPVRPVLTTRVEVRTAETFGPFAGTVEPRYQTQAGFRVPGRMVARDVYVGDLVPRGARLAALDPTVLQFAVTRARADVTDAEAQLANANAVEGASAPCSTAATSPRPPSIRRSPPATPPRRASPRPGPPSRRRPTSSATPP